MTVDARILVILAFESFTRVSQVSSDEWLGYLNIKKTEKGKKKFGYFLNYLEQVPVSCFRLNDSKSVRGLFPLLY